MQIFAKHYFIFFLMLWFYNDRIEREKKTKQTTITSMQWQRIKHEITDFEVFVWSISYSKIFIFLKKITFNTHDTFLEDLFNRLVTAIELI